jgi:hypothetical protein
VVDFEVMGKAFRNRKSNIVKVMIAIEINCFLIESNAFSTIISSAKAAIESV